MGLMRGSRLTFRGLRLRLTSQLIGKGATEA
jgi:hypothetical protein